MRNIHHSTLPRGEAFSARQKSLATLLLISLALLTGCASAPQTRELLATPSDLPRQVEITETPFFPQEQYQCGPAALATVLKHSGVDTQASELVDEIYLPNRRGSLQIEILASARRHGRLPYRIARDMRSLLREVAAGNPVLVLQNLGLSFAPQWHYAVVVGFDLNKEHIILRSGTEARHITDMDTFELSWERGSYWALVILPAEKLPATADAESFVRTIVAMEKIKKPQWTLIHTAYRSAASRWPNNLLAQMGLGNSAYQLGDLNIAEQAFRDAVRDHPDTGAAHNNLAQVLLELSAKNKEKLSEAEAHAKKAVALGGKHVKSFRATLKEIKQAQQQ